MQSVPLLTSLVTNRLEEAGIENAGIDAELLIAHVLHVSRGDVRLAHLRGDEVDDEKAEEILALSAERAERVPLQHLTGRAPFRHLDLHVGKGVFVPRPETETLAQIAINYLAVAAEPEPIAVDLGSGSGAIALAMATEAPRSRVFAVERSDDAVVWTKKNVAEFGGDNISVIHGSFHDDLPELEGKVAVVATNPPYIPEGAIPRDPEVRLHDPYQALYSGQDGLDDIRILSKVGLKLARAGGLIAIEHGELQGSDVRDILRTAGWTSAATHPDLTQRDRVTTAIAP